jgi:hypothetical protein
MFTRRDLLTSGTTLLLLVPTLGCSSSSDAPACDAVDSTSTVDSAHSHTVCVSTADLTSAKDIQARFRRRRPEPAGAR